ERLVPDRLGAGMRTREEPGRHCLDSIRRHATNLAKDVGMSNDPDLSLAAPTITGGSDDKLRTPAHRADREDAAGTSAAGAGRYRSRRAALGRAATCGPAGRATTAR